MVPRREHHVPHPRLPGNSSPFLRIEAPGGELIRQLRVLLGRNLLVEHHPLALARDGVQPPVDEEAELGILPPRHVFRRQSEIRGADRVCTVLECRTLLIRCIGQRGVAPLMRGGPGALRQAGRPVEPAQVPLVSPLENRAPVFELHRKPYVPAVDQVPPIPPVRHEDEGALTARHRQHVCRLRIEGRIRPGASCRVAAAGPGPLDGVGCVQSRLVRPPAGAGARDEVVRPLVLEERGGLAMIAVDDHILFGGRQVVIAEPADAQVAVVSRSEDVIGRPIIVPEQRHVARHVAVRPKAPQELVGPGGRVADRHRGARGAVALAPQLQVEPHHIPARRLVEEHLRPLHDASPGDVMVGVILDRRQRHTLVPPVVQVPGGVDVDALRGALGPLLAKPVVDSALVEQAATVGIDVPAVSIGPDRAGGEASQFPHNRLASRLIRRCAGSHCACWRPGKKKTQYQR